jgi:hypothetical protein
MTIRKRAILVPVGTKTTKEQKTSPGILKKSSTRDYIEKMPMELW